MKFKFKFQQSVEGIETCECVIDADDEAQALEKLQQRQFTSYLVLKQDAVRTLIEDFEPEVTIVKEAN